MSCQINSLNVVDSSPPMSGGPSCTVNQSVDALVQDAGIGGVFSQGDMLALQHLIEEVKKLVGNFKAEERQSVTTWANCFNAQSGAEYLCQIFETLYAGASRPAALWECKTHGI